MTLFYTIWAVVIILILAWCVREEMEYETYTPNEALFYFTQWELQRESPLSWAVHGEGFEVWCAAVDHYMADQLRDFPEVSDVG